MRTKGPPTLLMQGHGRSFTRFSGSEDCGLEARGPRRHPTL